jgi:hypothetical protein
LLREAERVFVFAAPARDGEETDPGADLVEALRWHGITAHRLGPASDADPVGEARPRVPG